MMANLASVVSKQPINWFAWCFDYPAGYGYSLPVVYAAWALAIGILYFPCRWFAGLKQRNRGIWWLALPLTHSSGCRPRSANPPIVGSRLTERKIDFHQVESAGENAPGRVAWLRPGPGCAARPGRRAR